MASLKDMRVRIAATKATQKITKAMQMVAASKLRRAQTAAEAARPYAERMGKVLGSIASAVAGSDSAPKLLAGTGADKVHLLVVCTAERGLCGPFNSSIVRLARDRANALMGQGKEVKILCVGRKGQDQLRRVYGKQIIETIELRGVRVLGFEQAEMISKKIVALFEEGELSFAVFVSPEPVLVSRQWAAGLLAKPQGEDAPRSAVLAGRPGADMPDPGPIICACFSVGANSIVNAVTGGGCLTVEAIGAVLKAGTNCGSCRGEIRAIIEAHRLAAAE